MGRISGFLRIIVGVAALLFVLGNGKPASAAVCFADLGTCYTYAATTSDWGWMWLQGLDCELSFVDCTRRAVFGR